MSFIYKICLTVLLFVTGTVSANTFKDDSFNQDLIIVTSYDMITIASFNNIDHIIAYNIISGSVDWSIPFNHKIISWKMKDGSLYVLGKDRYNGSISACCINPTTGYVYWEKIKTRS